MNSRKEFYKIEKVLKGVANHRRIEMLELIVKDSGLSGEDIAEKLNVNYQTGSSHLRKLVRAELVSAYREGQSLAHDPSPLGLKVITFLKKLK